MATHTVPGVLYHPFSRLLQLSQLSKNEVVGEWLHTQSQGYYTILLVVCYS